MIAPMRVTLRPYQENGVLALRDSFRRHRSVCYALPTGGGKTVVFSFIAESAVAKGNRVLILVHRQELVEQAVETVSDLGLPVGVIAAGYTEDPTCPVQVASVQTLVRRLEKRSYRFDLVIVDEAHHAVAGSWERVLAYCRERGARVLGVTATPQRLDGRGLREQFEDLVVGPSVRELVVMGFLARPLLVGPPVKIGLDQIRRRGGDWDTEELSGAMHEADIYGDTVRLYQERLDGKPTIVFCVSIADAEEVAQLFRDAGYRACSVDGNTERAERRARIRGLGDGSTQVLTSCQIVSEGTDVPAVAGAILLRPTLSLTLYLQQVGRALRPKPDGSPAIILDQVGNWTRHFLPDTARDWTLDGRKKKKDGPGETAPPVKQCPECYEVVHASYAVCPGCGYEWPPKELVTDEQAVLEEITEEDVVRLKEEQRRQARREESLAQTYDDLLALEKARGYKPGWARHRWEGRLRRGVRR